MRKKKTRAKKRRFKRTSNRRLSSRDLLVLDFLWTWKVATSPMLEIVAYANKSHWWVYKALRRLKSEKYIQLLPRGRNLSQELWALTEHGFEVVLMDRDDLESYRYKPHAPTHDFLATCLQLGDIWLSKVEKQFFTEQMLASLAPSNFPKSFREVPEHVPDGISMLRGPLNKAFIGYEVDINLKAADRYQNTFRYYELGMQVEMVVWLVRNTWMANRIIELYYESSYQSNEESLMKKVAFVLLDDFKQNIWGAKTISTSFAGISLRKAHANLLQSLYKTPAKLGQKDMAPIFFPPFKSPQKTISYTKEVEVKAN